MSEYDSHEHDDGAGTDNTLPAEDASIIDAENRMNETMIITVDVSDGAYPPRTAADILASRRMTSSTGGNVDASITHLQATPAASASTTTTLPRVVPGSPFILRPLSMRTSIPSIITAEATPKTPHTNAAASHDSNSTSVTEELDFDGEPLKSRIQPERLAIGSPESIIENTREYHIAQQIEINRQRNNTAASHPPKPATSPIAPSFTPSSATAPASDLRSQLRAIASSTQFQRSTRAEPRLAASPIPMAASFDQAASASYARPADPFRSPFIPRSAASSASLSMSQLRSSPFASPLPSASNYSTTVAHSSNTSVNALHHNLNDFNASLYDFQDALLESRQRLAAERTAALENMRESIITLKNSLQLEVNNRDSSQQALQKVSFK